MENVLGIIEEISSTSSRNDKELILKRNKDNLLLKKVLEFIYNPYIVTGLSSKKIRKKVRETIRCQLQDVNELMDYLSKHNTGTDKDIAVVQEFISRQPQELQELYIQMCTKSLKIGVTAKTLNKVYGKGFIPEFNVMLADRYFDNEDKVKGEFIVTTKLDGLRCVIIKENGGIKIFSRQGQLIEDLVEILEESTKLPDNMVYDGELLLRNDKGLASKDLYRATMKEARKDGIKKNLVFNCFDVLPVEDFKNGICKIPCVDRKKQIHKILSGLELKHIIEVPVLYYGSDKSEIIRLLNEAKARGEEGVMVNMAGASNSYYECKRTKNLLKVKVFNEADVRVVDIIEGDGKNKGKLGAITVQFEHEGQIYETNIGSGFSDIEREKYFNNPELILNKIVTVGYFEISQNQQGGFGFRFGTWKGIIRDDKDEISMY